MGNVLCCAITGLWRFYFGDSADTGMKAWGIWPPPRSWLLLLQQDLKFHNKFGAKRKNSKVLLVPCTQAAGGNEIRNGELFHVLHFFKVIICFQGSFAQHFQRGKENKPGKFLEVFWFGIHPRRAGRQRNDQGQRQRHSQGWDPCEEEPEGLWQLWDCQSMALGLTFYSSGNCNCMVLGTVIP